jgi:hypothetical protein
MLPFLKDFVGQGIAKPAVQQGPTLPCFHDQSEGQHWASFISSEENTGFLKAGGGLRRASKTTPFAMVRPHPAVRRSDDHQPAHESRAGRSRTVRPAGTSPHCSWDAIVSNTQEGEP